MKKIFLMLTLFFCFVMLVGCEKEEKTEVIDEIENTVEDVKDNYDINSIVKEYKPNELGDIPVIMYHAIVENPPSVYQRSVEGFKKDLEYMYEHDYVTISNTDYVNFNIDIKEGKTPILITFDDGEAGTFDLVKNEDGSLSPRKDTAIYLMEEFYKEHPDFGRNAILFINGHEGTFNDNKTDKTISMEDKIKWLFDNGYEVSNHTYGHLNMSKSTAEEIEKQVSYVDKLIKEINPNANLNSIAYPFGARPSEGDEHAITNGSYNGYNYSYKIGFREGPSKPRFYPIICNEFENLNVPRLRGNEGEVGDMWSYFENYEKYPSQRFISDGNKDILTIPSDKLNLVNYDVLDKNIKVVTYDKETLEVDNMESNEITTQTSYKVLY